MPYGPLVPGPYPTGPRATVMAGWPHERLDALVDLMLQHADPRQDNYSAIAC
jgi:hypothetical protein